MRRFFLALGVFALGGVGVVVADNQPASPVQPQPVPLQPAPLQPGVMQPNQPMMMFPGNPAMIPRLEEDLELLEAQRDTKKAYVKAAEVGIKVADVSLERITRIIGSGAAGKEDADKARLEVDVAKAQYEIRVAEMKEVEVKIKHAKKRLDEAKANAGFRPLNPAVPPKPKPVEPPKQEKKDPTAF
jgi:hypothetical protein